MDKNGFDDGVVWPKKSVEASGGKTREFGPGGGGGGKGGHMDNGDTTDMINEFTEI